MRWAALSRDSFVARPGYGLFGIVLGLFAWIYLIAELTVYAAELNVVLARKLWPRAMVQPPLTDADRRSMAAQALQNQRRPEQHVDVSFDDGQDDGGDEPAEKDRDRPSETVQSTPGAGPKA